jgi:hypothetical protein
MCKPATRRIAGLSARWFADFLWWIAFRAGTLGFRKLELPGRAKPPQRETMLYWLPDGCRSSLVCALLTGRGDSGELEGHPGLDGGNDENQI